MHRMSDEVIKEEKRIMDEMTTVCEYCGTRFQGNTCPNCGAAAQISKMQQAPDKPGEKFEELVQNIPSMIMNNLGAKTDGSDTTTTTVSSQWNGYTQTGFVSKNKWVAFLLCLFFGYIGVHKIYEGKIGMAVLYFFTVGLFCIGWIADLVMILGKPNPYYVIKK